MILIEKEAKRYDVPSHEDSKKLAMQRMEESKGFCSIFVKDSENSKEDDDICILISNMSQEYIASCFMVVFSHYPEVFKHITSKVKEEIDLHEQVCKAVKH